MRRRLLRRGARAGAAGAPFAPPSDEELRASLTGYLLERTLHEIGYELEQRPEWLPIPLSELFELMKA